MCNVWAATSKGADPYQGGGTVHADPGTGQVPSLHLQADLAADIKTRIDLLSLLSRGAPSRSAIDGRPRRVNETRAFLVKSDGDLANFWAVEASAESQAGGPGVRHPYPFAFSLPVDFYDVGLHSVIVGDEDSDVAHVPTPGDSGHLGRRVTPVTEVESFLVAK